MVCSKDELLLVLTNWMTTSQSVVATILLAHKTGSSSPTIARIRGFVQCVTPELFVIGRDAKMRSAIDVSGDDFIFVFLDDWEFAYADPLERPAMNDGLVGIPSPISEGVSLTKPDKVQISVFAIE